MNRTEKAVAGRKRDEVRRNERKERRGRQAG